MPVDQVERDPDVDRILGLLGIDERSAQMDRRPLEPVALGEISGKVGHCTRHPSVRGFGRFHRRLPGRDPCDLDAVRGARDVVESRAVAELDRLGVAAVLTADAELDVRLDPPRQLGGHRDELADAILVERLERVGRQDVARQVPGQELALGIVSAERQRRLGQVVGAEREEVRLPGDLVGGQRRTRHLDHGPHQVFDPLTGCFENLLGGLVRFVLHQAKLLFEAHQRDHDLDERRLAGLGLDRAAPR